MAQHPLNVTVIGAGLAGLLAARVLREKHNVTILEKWKGSTELGAAINIGPNGSKIIESLGFDKTRCKSIAAGEALTYLKDGVQVNNIKFEGLREKYGSDWYFQHRGDLWTEFYLLATAASAELGISGQPAKMIWEADVVHVEPDSGLVTLSDGRTFESDLVVGADGIKSIVRPLVVGEEAFRTARPSGTSAFRFTIPRSDMEALDPKHRMIDSSKPGALEIHLSGEKIPRQIVMYPCRNFELVNVGCIVPDSILQMETTESWSAKGSKEDLMRCYEDFDSKSREILGLAQDIKLWQLRDQDPLPSYIKGRTVIIGDAAHAMTPHQGQGGNQAIEDAEAFRLFDRAEVSRATVPSLLRDFDRVRRPRASKIQDITRLSQERKTPDTIYRHTQYNYTYHGVEECLRRLDAGLELLSVPTPAT